MADAKEAKKGVPEESGEAAVPKKSKGKLIILLVTALMVLGGGGFGVYQFVLKKPVENVEANVPEKTPKEKVDEVVGTMYPLQTFLVNIGDEEENRFLKTTLTLELDNDAVKDELDKRIAQVRDIILLQLSTKRFSDVRTVDGKYILREELLDKLNSILITGKIKNIYFTEFIVQ
ncbi:MAG: flagellar basal body protein FliL [Deltaproteobacteria bacterium]|nr:flagellar basal body protein FliL [Deltaproteobacteria bacterium]